jgi:hypothetical protein
MNERDYTYTGLGMLLGIFVGGGLAAVMFAITGQAFYFSVVGIGLTLGLRLGAALDAAFDPAPVLHDSRRPSRDEP